MIVRRRPENIFIKSLVKLILFTGVALLSSCGGGSGDSPTDDGGLTVTPVNRPSFKELTPAQAASAKFPDNATVEFSTDTKLDIGDVVVVADRILKITGVESGSRLGMTRYGITAPHLEDLFENLVLDGVIAIDAGSAASLIYSSPILNGVPCDYKQSVVAVPGISCNFNSSTTDTSSAQLEGTAAFGARLSLKKWDVIKNTGSGTIDLDFDVDMAVHSDKNGFPSLVKGDVCSSSSDAVTQGRVRLLTLSLPTALPNVNVRIPFCLARTSKADITGNLFRFKQRAVLTVAVGEKKLPSVISDLPRTSQSEQASDQESWFFETQVSDSVYPVYVSTNAALAAELSVEVAASPAKHPKAVLVERGLMSSFTGSGAVSGRITPATQQANRMIGMLRQDPLYCLDRTANVDFQLTAYASLPAFRDLIGSDFTAYRQSYSPAVPVWSDTAKLGGCDIKVNTRTQVTPVSSKAGVVNFVTRAIKEDPLTARLWEDRSPTGIVTMTDAAGQVLCLAEMSQGQGACMYTYPGGYLGGAVDRFEKVYAKYTGDAYFIPSSTESDVRVTPSGFTKISEQGNDLPQDALEWSCVRHNVTGLLWEAHVKRETPTYTCVWGSMTMICQNYTNFGDGRLYDASSVPATVGSRCGKSGWRLPTREEGLALVSDPVYAKYSTYEPNFQLSYKVWFGADDTASTFWTSSPVESNPDAAWRISYMGTVTTQFRDQPEKVRLVR